MTLQERATAYAQAFPQYPASHLSVTDRWLNGMWLLGNHYRGSGYYGAFPPSLLARIWALYPDVTGRVLHVCSGSLTKRGALPSVYSLRRAPRAERVQVVRIDIRRTRRVHPTVQGDVQRLPFRAGTFDLLIADPPYGAMQAVNYGVKMPVRTKVLHAAWGVAARQAHLVWFDQQIPMFNKKQWHLYGTIGVVQSTNHAVRVLSLFERV